MPEFVPKLKGKQLENAITITIDGKVFAGWESVTLTKELDSIAHTFSLNLDDRFLPFGKDTPIRTGKRVKINIGKDPVLTGRIETMDISFGKSDRQLTVGGRSLPGDLVDSSVVGAAEYTNISLEDLAKTLVAPFGLRVFLSVVPKQIDKFGVKPGETVFEALDRAARLQGFFWISTRGGNIRLTRAGRDRTNTELHENINFLSGGLTIDDSKRFSDYKVIGQTSGSDDFGGILASGAEGNAKDNGVARHRPLTLVAEGSVNTEQAQDRAEWELVNRIAIASEVNLVTQGWRQNNGELWDINQIVHTHAQTLGVNTDLLIRSIEQTKGNDGTFTTFGLVRKDSYIPQPTISKAGTDSLSEILGH